MACTACMYALMTEVASSPRCPDLFQRVREERGGAWYLIARDWLAAVRSMGRVGEGYKLHVGSVQPERSMRPEKKEEGYRGRTDRSGCIVASCLTGMPGELPG